MKDNNQYEQDLKKAIADSEKAFITYAAGDSVQNVNNNITLNFEAENESTITWNSSDVQVIEVIEEVDALTTPLAEDGNKTVVITAIVTNGTASFKKNFKLMVISEKFGSSEDDIKLVEADLESIIIGYRGTDNKDSVTTHYVTFNR